MNWKPLISMYCYCLALLPLAGQDTLWLTNPSFEDTPRHSKNPQGWINCGPRGETPPDIGPTDFFRANTQPSQGKTHLVMVTRDNGHWESIGNLLSQPLQAGQCYHFTLDLARSSVYLSLSQVTWQAINFTTPIRLRILGANQKGKQQELLSVSELVTHEDWQTYSFVLCPQSTQPMLILEAMYAAGTDSPYAGNIMLDNCSNLQIIQDTSRVDAQLLAWEQEAIPRFSRRAKNTSPKADISTVDTIQIQRYLNDIEQGRIDIGLSELAAYAGNFSSTPWIITIDESDAKATKTKLRLLRRRIKAMDLQSALRVEPFVRLADRLRFLVEGKIGIKG